MHSPQGPQTTIPSPVAHEAKSPWYQALSAKGDEGINTHYNDIGYH